MVTAYADGDGFLAFIESEVGPEMFFNKVYTMDKGGQFPWESIEVTFVFDVVVMGKVF